MATKSPKPVTWNDLGPPPLDDALETNAWVHRSLAVMMHKAMTDIGLDERQRRRELREIAGTMRGLIPQARLQQAEEAVRGDKAALTSGAGAGPELEDAAQLTGPGDQPKAKRGRPRKRSLL